MPTAFTAIMVHVRVKFISEHSCNESDRVIPMWKWVLQQSLLAHSIL